MSKDKKVYSKSDLEGILAKVKGEYENRLGEQKDRIFELVEENKRLQRSVDALAKKDKLVGKALEAAVEKAKEIEETSRLKYRMETERLRNFQEKWQEYYREAVSRYPVNGQLEKMQRFVESVEKILSSENFSEQETEAGENAEEVRALFAAGKGVPNKGRPFNPAEKIKDFISGESSGGFNMDDVLNPKEELDLEKLLKELGIG